MVDRTRQEQLQALLRQPSLWRGRGAATPAAQSTGFAALDAVLPGGGWPRGGLVEVLVGGAGHGELTLWMPLLRGFAQQQATRCCAFIAPPFELFAPAWRAAGVPLAQLLVVRGGDPLWALEQSLLSGVCAASFGWLGSRVSLLALRRLALAAGQGAALGVLVRPLQAAREPTAAVLRLAVKRDSTGLAVQLLKGRGITPCTVTLKLP